MATNIPNSVNSLIRLHPRSPRPCEVCGDAALYSYFGAIVCPSCKMFFKRNADNLQRNVRCNHNSSCEINMNTRHQCSYCRLTKCFSVGMDSQMIRPPRIIKNKNQQTGEFISNSTHTNLTRTNAIRQPEQLPILNLVQRDLSKFNKDEWNLMSNIIHHFDEYIGYAFTQDFIQNQTILLPKLRFKSVPVTDFLISSMNNVQVVVEKNHDFLSLSSDERMTLLRSTVEYTSSVGGLFILRHHQLFNYASYYRTVEIMFGHIAIASTKYIIDQLDPDDTFIKLIISLLSFSTINYRDYKRNDMNNLNDTKRIISIQDMYASLVWKYMLYRYDYKQVVKRFSNLIRCLLSEVDVIKEAYESNQFNHMIDAVIEHTKHIIIF